MGRGGKFGERLERSDTASTSPGPPLSGSVPEFRRMSERYSRRHGWALAKAVVRKGLGDRLVGEDDAAIGWVRFLAIGLHNRVYAMQCRLQSEDGEEELEVVVRLPRADAPSGSAAKAQREAALLRRLASLDLPIRTPRVLALVDVEEGVAIVQEALPGFPLDTRVSRCPGRPPWEDVAEAASVCHGLDPASFHDLEPPLTRHRSRREHASARLSVLEAVGGDEARAALEWCREHLPPPTPCRLLHGDLLGQNILRSLDENVPIGLIDWSEACFGDPAYDLAIVIRGRKKPFGSPRGLQRLLEAYHARSDVPVTATEVHLQELCLVAGFVQQEIDERGADHPHVTTTRQWLRGLLRRAEAASGR